MGEEPKKRIRIEKHIDGGEGGERKEVRVHKRVIKRDAGDGKKIVVVASSSNDIDVEEIEVDDILAENGFEWEDDNGHTVLKVRVPKHQREDGDDDALVRAAGMSGAIENLESEIGAIVKRARAQGYSWTQIGEALGTSKQAAWERFSGEE